MRVSSKILTLIRLPFAAVNAYSYNYVSIYTPNVLYRWSLHGFGRRVILHPLCSRQLHVGQGIQVVET